MVETCYGLTTSPPRPHDRRLFGMVLRAFYHACDQSNVEVTTTLFDVLTHLILSSDSSHKVDRRRSEHDLIIARELVMRLARRIEIGAPSQQASVRLDVLNAGTCAGCGVAHE
jgi:hypothetical protein